MGVVNQVSYVRESPDNARDLLGRGKIRLTIRVINSLIFNKCERYFIH